MKAIVSVGGRFHSFHMAEQLYKRGHLHRFLTTRPDAKRLGIDGSKVVLNVMPEFLDRVPSKIPLLRDHFPGEYLKAQMFDTWAAERIERCDVAIIFAAFALHTMRAAKALGIPTILERGSAHVLHEEQIVATEYQRLGRRFQGSDQRLLSKQLWEYGEADYIMVPSTFAKKSYLDFRFAEERLLKVPLGVDLRAFYPGEKNDRVFRVIHMGGSIKKGTHYLLEAFDQLNLKDSELLLIGGIENTIAELLPRLKCNYRLVRHIVHEKLSKLLSEGSIMVHPSLADGWAMVVTEAMACGLPVVVTPNTGASDIVRDGHDGFVVPVRDSDALKEKLLYLYEHRGDLKAMGESAASRAREYSWERYGDEIVGVYAQLVDRKAEHLEGHDETRVEDFYEKFWEITDLWGNCGNWSEAEYERHFSGLLTADNRVLDVGCGDARAYQRRVISQVKELFGVEISSNAAEKARKVGVNAIVQSLESPLQFADARFDRIICLEVVEHLFDPLFALKEMWRVLEPGGILILSVPNVGYFRDRLQMFFQAQVPSGVVDLSNPFNGPHIRFFNSKSITKALYTAGFDVEHIKPKVDCSIFDCFETLGPAGRYLSRLAREKMPSFVRLEFLGEVWPSLFAPGLIVIGRKPRV